MRGGLSISLSVCRL